MDTLHHYKHPESVYPSLRDTWLIVVLHLASVSMLFAALVPFFTETPLVMKIMVTGLMFASIFFVQWTLWRTRYSLLQRMMLIECGPFHYRVKYSEITSVHPTNNPLSSPALSLNRLLIHHRGRRFGIMISPINPEEFLQELVSRDPGLEINGLVVKRHTEHGLSEA